MYSCRKHSNSISENNANKLVTRNSENTISGYVLDRGKQRVFAW